MIMVIILMPTALMAGFRQHAVDAVQHEGAHIFGAWKLNLHLPLEQLLPRVQPFLLCCLSVSCRSVCRLFRLRFEVLQCPVVYFASPARVDCFEEEESRMGPIPTGLIVGHVKQGETW